MEKESTLPLSELEPELEKKRWEDLDKLIYRKGPFAHPAFTAGDATKNFLQNVCRVLIIGAGGLGCDLVKNLALSGFRNIDIIDMDTIDLSNLNRQFLFRKKDVGKSKAEVAAAFVNKRVPGAKVVAHNCKIQEKDLEFYEQFHIVISGLDSISARRWINSTLVGMVEEFDDGEVDMSTCKLFVDGGTEGFKGQARVITPRLSSCFECTMDLFPPQTTYPRCTIAHNPRLPEHCIMWALEVLFSSTKSKPEIKDDEQFDADNEKHCRWIFERAKERAKEYGIRGVNYRLTKGVVKNIIPAIASTNAVVASICTNEALKLATLMAKSMDDYMMYNGNEGIYTYTYKTEKKDTCYTCGTPPTIKFPMKKTHTLEDLIGKISEHPDIRFSNPSVSTESAEMLYNIKLPYLVEYSTGNLKKTLVELEIEHEDELSIVDTQVLQDGGFVIQVVYEE